MTLRLKSQTLAIFLCALLSSAGAGATTPPQPQKSKRPGLSERERKLVAEGRKAHEKARKLPLPSKALQDRMNEEAK